MPDGDLRIDQCLFGYDDGHRLLESSMRLDPEVASQLTLLSDLAPGVLFGSSDSYWTGLPIPKLGRYALMRTWTAPEMPRPGCVWTHVLLLETSIFEIVSDLWRLRDVARRPIGRVERRSYAVPIEAAAETFTKVEEIGNAIDWAQSEDILVSLYGSDNVPVLTRAPGELDDIIFAVWSQQWPRLRRNFRFRTSASRDTSASTFRFDLQLQLEATAPEERRGQLPEPLWLKVAATDLRETSRHALRKFLWHYGQDVTRQRGSFRPLCELFAIDRRLTAADIDLPRSIAAWFPEPEDAFGLKRDIVDGAILKDHQLDILSFLMAGDGAKAFPLPTEEGVRRLVDLWPDKADAMLALAEDVMSEPGELASSIIGLVLDVIPPSDFWTVTARNPLLQRRMLQDRPGLLDADEVAGLDAASLETLLQVIQIDDPIGGLLVRRVLAGATADIASIVMQRFPTVAPMALIATADESPGYALQVWWNAAAALSESWLNSDVLRLVTRTSTIYKIAETLGWVTPVVLGAGIGPWLSALSRSEPNLAKDDGDVLQCFLLAVAFECGGNGAQGIFEQFFPPIHERVLQSYLPWTASEILIPHLPAVGWFRSWDIGLRLRLGVTKAYVENSLDPRSFASLSDDPRVRDLLKAAAKETAGGKRYAKAITAGSSSA